ncbi:ROK family protein [soil metagenome]
MTQTIAADTQIMKGINAAALLDILRTTDRISVSELSTSSGLSRQAVTRALDGLEAAGFVEYSAPDPSAARSGRPAQLVRFRAEAGFLCGIAISSRSIRVAVADLLGRTLVSQAVSLDDRPIVQVVRDAVTSAVADAGLRTHQIWAATIGTPGIVDPIAGTIKLIPSMAQLEGGGLVQGVREILDCEVYLDNDVKLATEGEQWRGGLGPHSSLVLIEWGERVGAGVLINGVLHRGASNDAGDIGFLDLAVDAPALEQRAGLGAFENWVGGAEIVALAIAAADELDEKDFGATLRSSADHEALETVIRRVREGSPAAERAVVEAARRFVSGIAVVRALLDPDLVIIGGPMADCGPVLLRELRSSLAQKILNQPELELSTLGEDAVLFGAIHHSMSDIRSRLFLPSVIAETLSAQSRS